MENKKAGCRFFTQAKDTSLHIIIIIVIIIIIIIIIIVIIIIIIIIFIIVIIIIVIIVIMIKQVRVAARDCKVRGHARHVRHEGT